MVELPTHLRGVSTGAERVSRAELAAHQRERVISGAIPVFAKRGFQATTVDDLLAAAKMGFGNFYTLFEGKEECFLACFEEVVSAARARISAASRTGADWEERTYLGLRELLAALVEDPLAARLVLLEAQSAGAPALARYSALIDEAIAWLSHGRRGSAASLPESFEQTTIFGLAFYLQQLTLDTRSLESEALLEETAGLLLEPLIGRERLAAIARSALVVG
jgi:AcrR family transcriptional regulator